MFRQLLQRLLNSSDPPPINERNHTEEPKDPIQGNPVESIIKNSQRVIKLSKKETSVPSAKSYTKWYNIC